MDLRIMSAGLRIGLRAFQNYVMFYVMTCNVGTTCVSIGVCSVMLGLKPVASDLALSSQQPQSV